MFEDVNSSPSNMRSETSKPRRQEGHWERCESLERPWRRPGRLHVAGTPFPIGPHVQFHFPQFPLRFRRRQGAVDSFRVWAWRCACGGGGGGGGRVGHGRWEQGDRNGRFGAGDGLAERRLPAEVGQSNVSRGRGSGRDHRTSPPPPPLQPLPRAAGEAPGSTPGDLGHRDPRGLEGAGRPKASGAPRVSEGAALLRRSSSGGPICSRPTRTAW